MALKPPKPPPLSEVIEQVNNLVGNSALRGEVDRSVRALVQSALQKLDLVSREEFDAQAQVLQRTRSRVEELEQELEALTRELEALERQQDTD
jgi:BMFP domain-containing protein YqiC